MRRRIFFLASLLSLFLFAAILIPFAWRFVSQDEWEIVRRADSQYFGRTIELSGGYFMLTWYHSQLGPKESVGEGVVVDYPWSHYSSAPHRDAVDYDGIAGFGVSHRRRQYSSSLFDDERTLFVPLWPFVTVLAILPAVWLGPYAPRMARRLACWGQEHRREGICGACGYDLTCNTSGVCPECGMAVAGKAGV